MKILQISYNLISGGAERFVVDLSNQLATNPNNNVVLATTDNGENPHFNHYAPDLSPKIKRRFVGLKEKGGLKPKCIYGIFKIILEEKPDIVHIHCHVLLGYIPSFFYRKPIYFHTLHSLPTKCWSWKQLLFINKWVYEHLINPITISEECQRTFINYYNSSISHLITNGREAPHTTPLLNKVKCEIESRKRHPETPVIIHIARCQEPKNPQLLYETFYQLSKEKIDYLLIVIGRGHEEFAKRFNHNEQIYIVGEKSNIGDYLSCSDYFVLSSNREGLPLTLLEAMSMGVTPISTPAGGIKDVIRNGENGFITNSFDPKEFLDLIKDIITNNKKIIPELLMKEYSLKYSMDICSKKYYEYYKKFIKK